MDQPLFRRADGALGDPTGLATGLDSGDTAFIIICGALVLMMTLPGLVLFYSGLCGFKCISSTCLQTMAVSALISITWLMFGYSLSFGHDHTGTNSMAYKNRFIGGANMFWFWGDGKDAGTADTTRLLTTQLIGTIPKSVHIMYMMTFAILTACIAAGSFAERMKLSSMLIFFFFWHCLVYCPVCYWHWGQGFLSMWGILDFAGGNVVHIVAGVTGVVGSVILGPRKPHKEERTCIAYVLTFTGGCLLWIGWFGFNAGSAMKAGTQAGMAALITHLCASTCAFTWMIIEWLHKGKPTIIGIVSGAITGLVVITPAAGYVDWTAAFVSGLIGAVLCYALLLLKNKLKLDEKPNECDCPDAFGVHAIGGIVGALLLGFFANPAIGGPTVAGVFYKLPGDGHTNGRQLGWQIVGIIITVAYTAAVTAILMLILKFTIGINNPEDYDPCWECPEKKDKVAKDRDLKPGGDKTTIENHHHHHHETRVVPGPVSTVPVTMAPMNMMPMTMPASMPISSMPVTTTPSNFMGGPSYGFGVPPGLAGFA